MLARMDTSVETSKPKKSWWRSALRLVVCLCAAWLIYLEVMAFIPWYFARQMGRDYPRLSMVPRRLNDTSVATLNGVKLEKLGCSFQVPWSEISNVRDTQTVSIVSFKSGAGIVSIDARSKPNTLETLRTTFAKKGMSFERMFGRELARTNYDFMMAAARTTPEQIRFFASRYDNARDFIFLTEKLTESPINGNAFFEIEQGEMRGIQIGDPAVAPFVVQLNLFDREDHNFKLWLTAGKDAKAPVMTQTEVNAIVRSLHGARETGKPVSEHANVS